MLPPSALISAHAFSSAVNPIDPGRNGLGLGPHREIRPDRDYAPLPPGGADRGGGELPGKALKHLGVDVGRHHVKRPCYRLRIGSRRHLDYHRFFPGLRGWQRLSGHHPTDRPRQKDAREQQEEHKPMAGAVSSS